MNTMSSMAAICLPRRKDIIMGRRPKIYCLERDMMNEEDCPEKKS